jgi:hypothetical protein
MSLGSSGNATIRRPQDGLLRCGVYRVGIVAVDTFYRAGDSNGSAMMGQVALASSDFGRAITRRFHTVFYSAASTVGTVQLLAVI